MLNRRLLRIKTLQVLYAYQKTAYKSIADAEKELLASVDKSYELYLLMLELFFDIAHQAGLRAELIGNRIINDRSESLKYTPLANNAVANLIGENRELQRRLTASTLSWNDNIPLVKDYMSQIIESEFYQEYITGEQNFANDKKLALTVVTDIFPLNESLYSYLEDKSIFWNDDIEFMLEMVVKTIRGIDEKKGAQFDILPKYNNTTDKEFLITLCRRAINERERYNGIVEKNLENWNLDRIAEIDLLLIQMAIIESVEFPSIPVKVTINEYIEIAKYYSTEKSGVFINGMVDKIVKQLVADKTINKEGRGLA